MLLIFTDPYTRVDSSSQVWVRVQHLSTFVNMNPDLRFFYTNLQIYSQTNGDSVFSLSVKRDTGLCKHKNNTNVSDHVS